MLDRLVEIYPQWTTRTGLSNDVGISAKSGTYGSYMSLLRGAGLLEEEGGDLRAHPDLFLKVNS